ncbi:MAG: hypothetical protein ACOCV2_09250 [Persicimonas sp.]
MSCKPNSARSYLILFAISVSMLGVGCSSSSSGPADGEGAEGPEESASLPKAAADSDCETEAPPTACEWVESTDAAFVATIDEVEPLTEPVVQAIDGQDGELSDSCDGVVNNGVIMKVDIDSLLHGDDFEEGDQVTVHVGFEQAATWEPYPRGDDGDIVWEGDGDEMLEEGTEVGMGIRYHPEHEKWSLMGEPMFRFDKDDELEFQDYNVQCLSAPEDWDGYTPSEVEDAASSCEGSDESDTRAETMSNLWGDVPEKCVAGVCIPDEESESDDECQVTMECDAMEECEDGECVEVDG